MYVLGNCQSSVGNLSVVCRWPVSGLSVSCRPTDGQQSVEGSSSSQLPGFLGLVNFSAKFIPNLASIAEPLHRLRRKETPFVWGTEQQFAFDALKSSLANAETLALF